MGKNEHKKPAQPKEKPLDPLPSDGPDRFDIPGERLNPLPKDKGDDRYDLPRPK